MRSRACRSAPWRTRTTWLSGLLWRCPHSLWPGLEVYISLQNGTIDAQENAADTCMTSNFQEVQKYLNFTNHILYLNQIINHNDKFNSLDPLYQEP